MSKPTQRYRRSFAGSVGSGMKSILGGDGRRYYVLEHKMSTRYHKAGECQKIIVDQIELGRDPKCQVRFDKDMLIVSRRHAAIVKDGDNWKLVQLSKTNSTYLNGHRVEKEWFLQTGDEIQLATNGPKLGFIVPQGDKGLVKSIGMTARLNLFRQQALRPYKQAIAVMAILLALSISGLGVWNYVSYQEYHKKLAKIEKDVKRERDGIIVQYNRTMDSLNNAWNKRVENLTGQIKVLENKVVNLPKAGKTVKWNNDKLEELFPDVYFILLNRIEFIRPDGKQGVWKLGDQLETSEGEKVTVGWSGTGFLLDDGRFVTARHVIESWEVMDGNGLNILMQFLNVCANNGGCVVAYFDAVSYTGKRLQLKSSDFEFNKLKDKVITTENNIMIKYGIPDETDYAYFYLGQRGVLKSDVMISGQLKRGTELTVLGYSLRVSIDTMEPMTSSASAACNGLHNGVILTTATGFESGNSGGPVFYVNENGDYNVIGIVSAGSGRSTGFVVPLSALK